MCSSCVYGEGDLFIRNWTSLPFMEVVCLCLALFLSLHHFLRKKSHSALQRFRGKLKSNVTSINNINNLILIPECLRLKRNLSATRLACFDSEKSRPNISKHST